MGCFSFFFFTGGGGGGGGAIKFSGGFISRA